MIYAELDENQKCKAILETSNSIEAINMIEIEMFDPSILGQTYNRENNTWISEPISPPDLLIEPTLAEIKENQLILMDALATLYETVTGGS